MTTGVWAEAAGLALAGLERTRLANAEVHLFSTDYTPVEATVLADLTAIESAYDGYAAAVVATWGAAYLSDDGRAEISSGIVQFDYGPAAIPPVTETVFGWWVELAGGALVAAGRFDEPMAMGQVGNSILLQIVQPYGGTPQAPEGRTEN